MGAMTTAGLSNSPAWVYTDSAIATTYGTTETWNTTGGVMEFQYMPCSSAAYGTNHVYTSYSSTPVVSDKYQCGYCGSVMRMDDVLDKGRCIHCGGPYTEDD